MLGAHLCTQFELQMDCAADHLPVTGSTEDAGLNRGNSRICSASHKSTSVVMRRMCFRKCLALWLQRTVCCLGSESEQLLMMCP